MISPLSTITWFGLVLGSFIPVLKVGKTKFLFFFFFSFSAFHKCFGCFLCFGDLGVAFFYLGFFLGGGYCFWTEGLYSWVDERKELKFVGLLKFIIWMFFFHLVYIFLCVEHELIGVHLNIGSLRKKKKWWVISFGLKWMVCRTWFAMSCVQVLAFLMNMLFSCLWFSRYWPK